MESNMTNTVMVVADLNKLDEQNSECEFFAFIITKSAGVYTFPCDGFEGDDYSLQLLRKTGEVNEEGQEKYSVTHIFDATYIHYYIIPREDAELVSYDEYGTLQLKLADNMKKLQSRVKQFYHPKNAEDNGEQSKSIWDELG